MGGHQSRQSVSLSSSVITNATYSKTSNCINVAQGNNIFSLYGNNNVIENVDQSTSLSVDAKCAQDLTQSQDFMQDLANKVVGTLKTQEVALTSWMTPGKSTQDTNVSNVVQTNISTKDVQNCLTQLSGTNIFSVVGSGNVVRSVVQNLSENKFGGCLGSNSQVVKASSDISNAVNQAQSDVQKNPFAFITDAIQAAVADVAIAVGVVVVVVVMVIVVAKLIRKASEDRKNRSTEPNTPPGRARK